MSHNEARELLVQGYEATHDAKGISKAYSVSERRVYRQVSQKRKTGSTALQVSRRGRKPVLSKEDRENIRRCIDERPDITIEEIRERLNLTPSYSTVDNLSIQDVAAAVGIPDSNYFTKLFKRAYGKTPLQYRKDNSI